jgi:hypothetical protein
VRRISRTMFVRAAEMVRQPGLFRSEDDADACRSFAAVEWHDSDKLLVRVVGCSPYKEELWTFRHFDRWW